MQTIQSVISAPARAWSHLTPAVLGGLALLMMLSQAGPAASQSQAINGNVEGIVQDTTGAVLPGVTIIVSSTETGANRNLITDVEGRYRAALLPLGIYRVRAELQGFKTVEQTGVSLSAGQAAVVNLQMPVGGVQEVVEVSAAVPVTEPAKIDLGRTITANEVHNLPNVSRNMYNFALLQPNVTGYENEEFGAARMNANGSQMRTNYQIDGSSATQKDRAGLRMFQPSEIMVQEVRVITSGFAPEFGQTTGMVYNAITPSGTNSFHGQGSYRFRRKLFSARPLTLAPDRPKPDTKVDNVLGTFGGPLARDKAFFYVGYERVRNDLSANRVITVPQSAISLLGLPSDTIGTGVIPAVQSVNMFIAKTDYQMNNANRLSARWSLFNNTTPENIDGGLNTRAVAVDFQDRMDSVGAQLTTTLGIRQLNEFRFAYGRRNNPMMPSAIAGPGPRVQITGVANFNGSLSATEFREKYWQVIDNFTWFLGAHELKVGTDLQFIDDFRRSDVSSLYVFPDAASYLAAQNGSNPRGYTRFQQALGDPDVSYSQSFYSFFVQDDFRVTPFIKLLYGVRYDVFEIPDANPDAPLPASKNFEIDKNNFAPRLGFVWSLDPQSRTVVRGSTGLMYEPPLGMFYQDAIQENGSPKLLTVQLTPTQAGAPAFPGTLNSLPAGINPPRSIRAIADDFKTQYAVLSNLQVERALTRDMSVALAYVNSTGRHLPWLRNSNVIPTGAVLGDGRPIFSRTLAAETRYNPTFDTINLIESQGRSQYNAFTASWNKRFSAGFQANASYTLAKAEDNGVIGSRHVIGSTDAPALSDPTDPDRDDSYTSWNVAHTFVVSTVIRPEVSGGGLSAMLINHNQLGVILQANSGLPFNILANQDLNQDGISADRPNGVLRNSGTLGTFVNVDFRYSRFVAVTGGRQAEVFLEAKNLFNRKNPRAVNAVVPTNAVGDPITAIPDEFPLTQAFESRQMQVGFKFLF